MKAVILAAGIGSRIRPLTDNTPKPLLKIKDKTILQMMVDNLLHTGIDRIAIVTGYRENQIKDFMAQTYPKLAVTYIRNELYDQTNTAYSLNLTKAFVGNGSFIKFDADVVFETGILKKLIDDPHDTCLCIDSNINLATEEVKVETEQKGKVVKVGKKLDPKISTGESIGIEKISGPAAKILFTELDNLLMDSKNFGEYYDDSYTTLINKGVPFYAVNITGLKWVEIDTLEDMELAKEMF